MIHPPSTPRRAALHPSLEAARTIVPVVPPSQGSSSQDNHLRSNPPPRERGNQIFFDTSTTQHTDHQDGQTRKVRALLQDDQIRHDSHSLELQHVPLGTTLVHLRVRQVQAQDLPDLHRKGNEMKTIEEHHVL
ncbi:unnamed protein product [Zymoseptoria tritici ST99CH_1A5]|uniref:Uncharacterized protein n=3 Tax=Zymoseptoria tritici TaxID=1047171 RepID=A0A1X7S617_ZYMT9|nr:unnamed protein product [Zymoseptoria tritici ST99CH_3D7]SMR59287.1 unnamed protein product [Zymoseptoria tritici ST99CH_1E4]SMR63123.1 unnamed protein product [Zymoseptoria tritici ST99CH_3D1]SMY28496.1 unnamed protein product [Zymoseptoria tritici ST99CH_1A5]SMY28505.1 unnamed protein product [Zymoseptoria tritici ST99CH_1A5]